MLKRKNKSPSEHDTHLLHFAIYVQVDSSGSIRGGARTHAHNTLSPHQHDESPPQTVADPAKTQMSSGHKLHK